MPTPTRIIRVFISSPGDVAEERAKAREILEQLQRYYGERVTIVPVLWEELPLPAAASFQEGIDLVLSERHRVDIAVFIMWSRLGSPLGGGLRKVDGSEYRSGTEREFDLMLAARAQSQDGRPHLLAYVRDDEAAFRTVLQRLGKDDLPEAIEQRRLAEAFVREWFFDEEGRNVRAYHSFQDPVSFAHRLRVHLRAMIEELLQMEAGAASVWTDGSPYRGLEVFDLEHASIFFGREAEVCEVELMLRRRAAESGCASVVVIGASGAGKSSFVRAGVSHSLLRENVDPETVEWRRAVVMPREAEEHWGRRLAAALTSAGALPEAAGAGLTVDRLGEAMQGSLRSAWELGLLPAFRRVSEQAGGAVRLLLIVDQLEELFTGQRFAETERRAFLEAVVFLAKTGWIRVILTLRSDYYAAAQVEPAFMDLKGNPAAEACPGWFDLLPPGPASVRALIERPAALSGLRFEREPGTGRGLEDLIAADAAQGGTSLPLLEYTLNELYEHRDRESGMLTFAAYQGLGGVKGALATRAEREFGELTPAVRKEFGPVMAELVTLGVAGTSERPARRPQRFDALGSNEARRQLLERLIAARLLTADRDEQGRSVVMLAHETLLWEWARLKALIQERVDFLRFRAHLEEACVRWMEGGKEPELLSRDREVERKAVRWIASGQLGAETPVARYLAESQRIVRHDRRWRMSAWQVFTASMCFLTLLSMPASQAGSLSTAGVLWLFLGPVAWTAWNSWSAEHRGRSLARSALFYACFGLGMTGLSVVEAHVEVGPVNAGNFVPWVMTWLREDYLFLAPLLMPVWFLRKWRRYPADFRKLRLAPLLPWWARGLAGLSVLALATGPFLLYFGLGEQAKELSVRISHLARDEHNKERDIQFHSWKEEAGRAQASGQTDESRSLLKRMLESNPETGNQHLYTGDVAWGLSDFETAATCYRRARISWQNETAYFRTQPKAELRCRQAAEVAARYWGWESNALHRAGKPEEAERALSDAAAFLRTIPGHHRASWLQDVLNLRGGLVGVAQDWAERARINRGTEGIWKATMGDLLGDGVVLKPEDAALVGQYAQILQFGSWYELMTGNYEASVEYAVETERWMPGHLWTASLRAAALLLSGKEAEAWSIYRANVGQTFTFLAVPGGGQGEMRTWHQFVATDFATLRSVGVHHPLMDQILAGIEPKP
jgi:tetratricopeptide (TPR) repeat protein